ncbi:Oidioi.mRNA.OKI2018_I69.XSR.g15784.t1.cds [Oikopleura dioica]|uniref:Splicing factor YJU2 n=1 Tax=Oikopleura dioica TaxID=34765 RepID=A0ABN7SJ17_OIKDI|nr:Oidioi.mRNA.OKI2018_I69.XSR.g15784.t1.cds [Oikopleura dioica]
MGDHKCMNEYYPPDYDPEKLPRLKTLKNWSGQGGQGRDRIMEIRTMLPWNIRCNTCGHYMYRGTKFNSRVEAATDYPKYLEYITIRRFYIRCLNCVSNITFITDPEAIDYAMEAGATRLFETRRLNATLEKEEKEKREKDAKENPMAALEKRTQDSQKEMLLMEKLSELTEERKAKLKISDDLLLMNVLEGAEEKAKQDDLILTKLAREVMRKEQELDEDEPETETFKKVLEERKRKTEMAPPVVPGKKKKTVDTKKALSKGFGGIKVKGKSITQTTKDTSELPSKSTPSTSPENEPSSSSSNPFGIDYGSDSDSD